MMPMHAAGERAASKRTSPDDGAFCIPPEKVNSKAIFARSFTIAQSGVRFGHLLLAEQEIEHHLLHGFNHLIAIRCLAACGAGS